MLVQKICAWEIYMYDLLQKYFISTTFILGIHLYLQFIKWSIPRHIADMCKLCIIIGAKPGDKLLIHELSPWIWMHMYMRDKHIVELTNNS